MPVEITIPKSVAGSKSYLQLIAIYTKDPVYNFKTINAGSSLKSGMLKLLIDETESTMDISLTKVKSSQMTI